jgi:signal transduction histidine kinase
MNNLLGNAIKYTPDGGTITINIYTEEDRFYFTVKDTGYGIPADQQLHIFEANFRAPATAHIGGTGVGLSLVKEVIERHGGQVWFTSEEGHGSTFGFWLPLLDNPLPANSA